MPVKPIYHKSPLASLHALPLGPGQVRTDRAMLRLIYQQMHAYSDRPEMWEGLFLLACFFSQDPIHEPVVQHVMTGLQAQKPDGAFPGTISNALQLARTALAVYEYGNDRTVLKSVTAWCGWILVNWEDVIGQDEIQKQPADLMDFLEKVYRYTGKQAILSLCDRLRMESLNWTSILRTFSLKRPMSQIASWLETRAGMDREMENSQSLPTEEDGIDRRQFSHIQGVYTRQYLTSHVETLAGGMHASLLNGLYSCRHDEQHAPQDGWQKIHRFHGVPAGGTTGDEVLEGSNPSCGMDTAGISAWVQALAAQLVMEDSSWAAEALDRIVHNSLPSCVHNKTLIHFQRVNQLEKDCSTRDLYHVHQMPSQKQRSLSRMARAWAAAYSSAVMTTKDGCEVQMYLDGDYSLALNGEACRVRFAVSKAEAGMTWQMRASVRASVALRLYSWMDQPEILLNGEALAAERTGDFLQIQREWEPGDHLVLRWTNLLRTEECYHQGMCVMYGHDLMSLDTDARRRWAVGVVGEPEKQDGQVVIHVRSVPEWSQNGGVPSQLPVRPRGEGEVFPVVLTPYSETLPRLSVFPRCADS